MSPQGPPTLAAGDVLPKPRLARQLFNASIWDGDTSLSILACACCRIWRICCSFCCAVSEELAHTASTWLCVCSAICRRCCRADCEMPTCFQQGSCLPDGIGLLGAVVRPACAHSDAAESNTAHATACAKRAFSMENPLVIRCPSLFWTNPILTAKLLNSEEFRGKGLRELTHNRLEWVCLGARCKIGDNFASPSGKIGVWRVHEQAGL